MLYFPPSQVLDANGNPAAGAKLNVYQSGTSTFTTIYADAGLSTPLPNPLIADSGGYLVAFYTEIENVKEVLTDATDVTISTVDPAAGIRLAQVTSGIEDTAGSVRMTVSDTEIRMDDPVLVGRITDTPQAYLHIVQSLANPPGTSAPPADSDALVIEAAADTGMTFITTDTDKGAISASATSQAGYAKIQFDYNAGTPQMVFYISGVEVFRVDGTSKLFTREFVSAGQAISSAGLFNIPHGLGGNPKLVQVSLVCLTAEFGWVVGEEILNADVQSYGAVALGRGVVLTADSSNIFARYGVGDGVNVFESLDKTTGARVTLTNANWNVIVRAWA